MITLVLLAGLTVFLALRYPPKNILSWDVFGYYLYLPATFIYDDPLLKDAGWAEGILDKYDNSASFYQVSPAENGRAIKYSCGLAILYSPFFFAGHMWANNSGHPADGFSEPYRNAVFYGSLLVSIIGLFFLRKVALKLFSDRITTLLLLLLYFGTNYSHNLVFAGAMPHNYLFTLYVLLIWMVMKYHQSYEIKYAALTGLLLGIIILIRPTEIVAVILPLFWLTPQSGTLKDKIIFLFKNKMPHLALAAFLVLLVWLPQFFYWNSVTGKFLYYSYDNPGEGFEFLRPYVMQVLFSFRKGWLVYTPMMIFGIMGLFFLYRMNRRLFPAVFVFFILNLYLVSSWSNWWYGGSFGQRALVQSYAVMSIPFGYAIKGILERSKWLKASFMVLALFFMALNVFQTWQVYKGIIHEDRMSRDYYLAVFGKTSVTPEDRELLLVERPLTVNESFKDEEKYQDPRLVFYEDFEEYGQPAPDSMEVLISRSGKSSLRMDSNNRFSPGLNIAFRDLTDHDHSWLRAGVYVMPLEGVNFDDVILVMTFSHGKYYKYRTKHLSALPDAEAGEWNYLELDYITPEVRSTRDELSVYVWFRGEGTVYVDDLRVVAFDPEDN